MLQLTIVPNMYVQMFYKMYIPSKEIISMKFQIYVDLENQSGVRSCIDTLLLICV